MIFWTLLLSTTIQRQWSREDKAVWSQDNNVFLNFLLSLFYHSFFSVFIRMSLLVSLVIDSCSGTEEFSPCLCIYISLQSPHEGNRHITSESNCLSLQKMFCELLVKLENYALSIRIIVFLSFSDTQRQAAMRYLQALGGKTHGLIMHTPKSIECKNSTCISVYTSPSYTVHRVSLYQFFLSAKENNAAIIPKHTSLFIS